MSSITIDVTSANICHLPKRPKFVCRRRMRRALSFPGVVMGQECARDAKFSFGFGNYFDLWQRVAQRHGKTTFGGPHENPVSVPAGWLVTDHRVPLVHLGLGGVSPNRFYTEVGVTIGGEPVSFIGVHAVSEPRQGVDHAAWRIEHWNTYHAAVATRVAELHAAGRSVVVGGDWNKPDVPPLHDGQVSLVNRGLDHLVVVPAAGKSVTVLSRTVIPHTRLMDHPIISAKFTIG